VLGSGGRTTPRACGKSFGTAACEPAERTPATEDACMNARRIIAALVISSEDLFGRGTFRTRLLQVIFSAPNWSNMSGKWTKSRMWGLTIFTAVSEWRLSHLVRKRRSFRSFASFFLSLHLRNEVCTEDLAGAMSFFDFSWMDCTPQQDPVKVPAMMNPTCPT